MCSVFKDEFQLKHFGFKDCEPVRFYQSQWFKNRWIFCGIKFLFLAYWFGWFVAGFVILPSAERWWIFLTNWGVTLLLIYFLASFALAIYGLVTSPDIPTQPTNFQIPPTVSGAVDGTSIETTNEPRTETQWFHNFVWIFHQLAFAMALLITAAFYILLTPSLTPLSINTHAINLVIMFIDLCLSDIPIRLLHFFHLSLAGVAYTVFSLILHGTGYESSIYPGVLDWIANPGFAIGLCLLIIFIISPVIQLIAYGLYQLRSFVARKAFGENITLTSQATNRQETKMNGQENAAFRP